MKMNRLIVLTLCLGLCLCLVGCGSSNNEKTADFAYTETDAVAEMDMASTEELTTSTALSTMTDLDAKLIRTVYIDAQTRQYEALMTALESKIAELGGYVESREAYNGSEYYGRSNRYSNLTIRIPADKLDVFLSHVNENCNVTNTRESVDNITLQYADTAARVEALEVEQTRLLELLEKAETMEDILKIEERLNDVRAELSSYAAQLKVMENQVSYATVHLYVDEVEELTPVEEPTVWERISRGFSRSVRDVSEGAVDFFVWVVSNSPVLVVWAVFLTGLYLGLRAVKRCRKSKKTPEQPNQGE